MKHVRTYSFCLIACVAAAALADGAKAPLTTEPATLVRSAADGATITGTIKFKDGTIAKGIPVQIIDPILARKKPEKGDKQKRGDDNGVVSKGSTDANGLYTCPNVPIGNYRVVAGSPMTGTAFSTVRVDNPGSFTVDFTLRPPRIPDSLAMNP